MKDMFWDCSSLTSCWHAVTYCETAPPHRQPSGREGKNGGMQREEHLVFSELALTGNVIDGRFTPSQAQIWTYTFVFMGCLQNGQWLCASGWIICLSCLMTAHYMCDGDSQMSQIKATYPVAL